MLSDNFTLRFNEFLLQKLEETIRNALLSNTNTNMVSLDLSTSRAPVINLSEKTTEEAFLEACGAPLTKILIEDLTPYSGPVTIPVRVIEGMGTIMDRGTVTEKQAGLI